MTFIPRDEWIDKIRAEPNGCWTHENKVNSEGYNTVSGPEKRSGGRRKELKAHRVIYEWLVGPISNGLQIDHLCRNRACLNPSHMEAVTGHENWRRGSSWSAINSRKTHCPKCGRELAGDNLFVEVGGGRRCRPCRKAYMVRYRAEHA